MAPRSLRQFLKLISLYILSVLFLLICLYMSRHEKVIRSRNSARNIAMEGHSSVHYVDITRADKSEMTINYGNSEVKHSAHEGHNIGNIAPTTKPKLKPSPQKAKHGTKWHQNINIYLANHSKICMADWQSKSHHVGEGSKPLCDCIPSTLKKVVGVNLKARPLNDTQTANPQVSAGRWEPKNCTARYKVAVVIPYRARAKHLEILLYYLHPILQGQQLNYSIIVVEQSLPEVFNKAALMNVGYVYAMQVHRPDCVVFHDVDNIPEDGRHFYTCSSPIVHLGAFHSRHRYRIYYHDIFGAVTAFKPEAFQKINGFSNRFFGWGGEDDDMSRRVRIKKYVIERHAREVSGYTVINHKRDSGNVGKGSYNANMRILSRSKDSKFDGLNTLKFNLDRTENKPLYQWLLVELLNDRSYVGQALNKR